MGSAWAVGWILIGFLFALALWVIGLDPPGFVWTITGVFGALGFLGGSISSAVLRLAEGRRRFEELSLPRFAGWGGMGGVLLGGLAGITFLGGSGLQLTDAVVAGVTILLGAGSAAGSLALARKAEDESPLAAYGDCGEVGPTETEGKRLLGGQG